MENREVINWLTRIRDRLMTTNSKQYEALTIAIATLEKQEQDRWRPCKERLPKEDGRYLITEKTDGTKVQEGYFCRTRDGEPYWGYLHVIAWRPLPEAYTEEEHDKP